MNRFLARVVAWLRAGYPEGVPAQDYLPLLALLSRRLSDDEVRTVAAGLVHLDHYDDVDIAVRITEITDELPSPADIDRVREKLGAGGWPFDDPRRGEGDA
ncbi:DUF3349 domain-containing protein [Mycobacterium sp. MYCO198283]|uniref:DUF3349 domain-containing protein n=1 Tax=Mycobacterium sp. MYCO198283 TaxID=2883505 RepID=UPI001E573975|nr:DUF3349 domain-containing protein [Mycobacterium sp. MYCO198283]MCG5432363.1 DUF3349 domain-containing protein [Mycobacterium sp. MYCO198283]